MSEWLVETGSDRFVIIQPIEVADRKYGPCSCDQSDLRDFHKFDKKVLR